MADGTFYKYTMSTQTFDRFRAFSDQGFLEVVVPFTSVP